MSFPTDLKYSEHDEWVRLDGETVILGITDFAQDALGELVHIELPEVGDTFDSGDEIAEVESVKAVSSIFTPVAGEVIEINEDLDGNEQWINEDPYAKGWLVKMRVSDASGLDAMLDVAAYQAKVADA